MPFFTLIIFINSCEVKNNIKNITNSTDDFVIENNYFVDSTFELKDKENEKICIKYNAADSFGDKNLNFRYFIKQKNKWELKSSYDSLGYFGDEMRTDHSDYNNDSIQDFAFNFIRGVRGANFWNQIIVYKAKEKKFSCLKGSKEVCAPWFDEKENKFIGVSMLGNTAMISKYKILSDSLIQTSKELFDNDKDSLIKKFKKENNFELAF